MKNREILNWLITRCFHKTDKCWIDYRALTKLVNRPTMTGRLIALTVMCLFIPSHQSFSDTRMLVYSWFFSVRRTAYFEKHRTFKSFRVFAIHRIDSPRSIVGISRMLRIVWFFGVQLSPWSKCVLYQKMNFRTYVIKEQPFYSKDEWPISTKRQFSLTTLNGAHLKRVKMDTVL